MHVTRNSANGDVCQPVKQLPQVNWWMSHQLDVLKPSQTKQSTVKYTAGNNLGLAARLIMDYSLIQPRKKPCESIQNTPEMCQFGLSFQGSKRAMVLCKHQVRFVFGDAERQRKRGKSKYKSMVCCIYCPDHPFFQDTPLHCLCASHHSHTANLCPS